MTEEKKSMVPKLRFPEFTATWEQRKLKDFTLSYSGGTPSVSNKNYYNGTIPFIRSGEISGERTELFITEEGLNKSSAKRVHKGQILYALYGATSGEVSLSKIDGAINQAILAISTKEGYSNAFLSFWLRKEKDRITATFLQGGQGNLSGEIVKNLIVPVPSQLEQTKIGDLFNQLDGIITLHQRKLEGLSKLKKSLLQKMFPKNGSLGPELRFPGFTGDWEQHKLGDLGHTYGGLSGKSKQDFGHGDARFVTYMNVFSNPIGDLCMVDSIEIDDRQSRVRKGDVLFTTSSETPDEVGMSCVWPSDSENLYLNSFCFGYRPTTKINSNFLASLLRSPSVREKIIFLAQGISRYNISKNKVMEISIPLPSEEEQSQIGDFFTQLDKTITLHQRKLESLKKLKKSLLQQMFV